MPLVLSVGGGKGGIGKTVITANLGMVMARLGHSALIIDADLGGSDLHNLLALDNSEPGLGELLTGRGHELSGLIKPVREPRLYFVPGDACLPNAANPKFQRKRKLFRDISRLSQDFVLLDLGAGSSLTVTDFFLSTPFTLLVMTPEQAAELNAFNFYKNMVYRLLTPLSRESRGLAAALALFRERSRGPGSQAMLSLLASLDGDTEKQARALLAGIRPKLVLNRLRSIDEFIQARQVQAWADEDLGLNVEIMAFLPEDEVVRESARSGTPALDLDPRAPFCRALTLLGLKLAPHAGKGKQWLEAAESKDSFTRAATEFAAFFPAPQ
ncbi:MAG: P-loop NTPase [Desulfarculales bacterium]|nr:P-loop NTPase [Desulfarculales bacterium]